MTTIDQKSVAQARALCAELRMFGSPTRGEHLGAKQSGTTFWELDGWPFVESKIAEALAAAGAVRSGGWVVTNAAGDKYRCWGAFGPDWTENRGLATRYARRRDAESAHDLDEDAWRVIEITEDGSTLIDLDGADWDAIQKAAKESAWMPPEYARNDWVSDVCRFLKHGGALPERRVRHLKRGSTYGVLGEAVARVSTDADGKPIGLGYVRQRPLLEGFKVTVYQDAKDGRLFVRFPDEFADGRFEEVSDG